MKITPPQKTTETTETETLGQVKFHLKSSNTMRYDISKASAPAMPKLGKGQNTPKTPPFSPLKSFRIACEPLV